MIFGLGFFWISLDFSGFFLLLLLLVFILGLGSSRGSDPTINSIFARFGVEELRILSGEGMESPQESLGMAPIGILLPRMRNSAFPRDRNLGKGLGFPRFLLSRIPGVVLVTWRGLASLCSPAGHCSCPGILEMGRNPRRFWGEIRGGFGVIPGILAR